jgi:hypothetical protein
VSETELYYQYAEECCRLAARMKDPEHKKLLEDMADAWAVVANKSAKKTSR